MQETGIIRRLDALGRVVIPREFRKLNGIEVGDPLEIKAVENGGILVKKVNMESHLKSMGALALSVLINTVNGAVGVCSQNKWLEFSGAGYKGLINGAPSACIIKAIKENRRTVLKAEESGIRTSAPNVSVYPIAGETGILGAYVFIGGLPSAAEDSALITVADFTAKSLQRF